MELDEIQTPGCKFPRIGNGRSDANKIGQNGVEHYPDDDDGGEVKRSGGGGDGGGAVGKLSGWPPSMSRIVRVSRATGGKDRHSKVLTSKGLRDRRVRLSVSTAIQFYDLQDRLGYDQPSKAVEWLLKAAASSISELPSLNTSFPETPRQLSDEKRSSGGTEHGFDSAEMELDPDGDPNYHHQQQNVSLSRSTCSSTSETSKGSGLSLSRSENRIKARERARERAAEKEKENESQFTNHTTRNASFTELLTGGISSVSNNTAPPSNETAHPNHGGVGGESNLFHKSARLWSSPPVDYFATRYLESSSRAHHSSSGYSGQFHLGNSLPQFSVTAGDHHHQELQQFSFVPEHLVPVASAGGGSSDYNLNFSISPGLAGYNRGTLQSNSSPSFLPHMHRFSPVDGSSFPFFIGSTAAPNAAPVENHHQFQPGFDGRVQLFYGDGGRHSDHKGKCKN